MLTEIDYAINEELLLEQCLERDGYEPFVDPHTGRWSSMWQYKRINTGYGKTVSNHFEKILGIEVKPRFFIQEKGFTLPFHYDRGTQCCINFVLSTSKDPIIFKKEHKVYTFKYKKALINVQEEHMIAATLEDRYLFKLSIFDMNYEQVKEILYENNSRAMST
jgi:hypothetical protein